MTTADITACALFDGLDAPRLRSIVALSTRRQAAAGDRLFEVGDTAREMYVVESGRVELILPMRLMGAEQPFVLQECVAGDVVAWSALIPPHRLTLGARCAEATTLMVFDRDAVLAHFDANPVTGRWVMANLGHVVGRRLVQIQGAWIRSIQRDLAERYR